MKDAVNTRDLFISVTWIVMCTDGTGGVWVGDVETQPDTWVCGSGKRSGLGDTLRRHHSFIQQMIVEHTLCASRGAGCWATQSPPQETPADLVKVVVNAMETDELAHRVRVRVRVRAHAYV